MQSTNLRYSGKRLHVWAGGTGPVLLLLHSAWGDAEMGWSTVWNDLARAFTVIAPDLPGFGASEAAEVPSLAGIAGVLKQLLDDKGIDRAMVVGNSFGVAAAVEFASLYPSMTAKLVAVNGGYLPSLPALMKRIITIPSVERRFRRAMRKMTYSDEAFGKAFPDRSILPPHFFEAIRQYEEQHSRIVYDAFMRQATPQKRPAVPSAIIWGAGDRLTGIRQAERMRKWLAVPQISWIDGAGHLPQVERPHEFVDMLRNSIAT